MTVIPVTFPNKRCLIYNNEATYADKWNTPENMAALKKIEDKYFDKAICASDCPVSWAPEVLELMDTLDKELGFRYNVSSNRGYHITEFTSWFFTSPIKQGFKAIWTQLFKKPKSMNADWSGKIPKPFKERLKCISSSFINPILYGIRSTKIIYVNPLLNKIFKNRISLSQLKEKYGRLELYFSVADPYEKWVEEQIALCEVKLAIKGAYYSLENLYDNAISFQIETDYHPESVTITHGEYNGQKTVTLKTTTHRKAMVECGLDLKEMARKVDIKKVEDGLLL